MTNILIVDDNTKDRHTLYTIAKQLLSSANVLTADRLGRARDILNIKKIDLLISEICFTYLNGLSDGYELVGYTKDKYPDCICILLTNYLNSISTSRAKKYNVDALVIKTHSLCEYKDMLKRLDTNKEQ
jgi:DNA-binding NtrC family response regulator